MPARSQPPLNHDRAWACVTLNLSVPGWGSWKAGRKIAGAAEMIIVFAGLALLGVWFLQWMNRVIQSELDESLPPVPAAWLWRWGIGLIGVSCVWTVVTCVSIMRQARAYENELSQNTPPRLADVNTGQDAPPRLEDLTKPPRLK